MKKRVLAAVLWFYTGWYAGAVLAAFLGLAPVLGPILGTAAAAVFAGDPRHIIWKPAAAPKLTPDVASTAVAEPA